VVFVVLLPLLALSLHVCEMIRSHVWQNLIYCVTWLNDMCVPWLIHICAMTHSYVCAMAPRPPCFHLLIAPDMCVWHDSFIRVCHDSFTYVPWLIHMCVLWLTRNTQDCSALQCVVVCCSVLQRVAVYAVCCSVLHCVALCCIVLQSVALCCRVFVIGTKTFNQSDNLSTISSARVCVCVCVCVRR